MATKKAAPAKSGGKNKPVKGSVYTPPNASKELPKSFYQQPGKGSRKKSEVPDN